MNRNFSIGSSRLRCAVATLKSAHALAWLLLTSTSNSLAQEPAFPPEAAFNATQHQGVLTSLGATRAEISSHLELTAPDIALPGWLRVHGRSQIPGTSRLVILRVTTAPASQAGSAAKDHGLLPLIAAAKVVPNQGAELSANTLITSSTTVYLLAQAGGRWFFASRDVKVGRPPDRTQGKQPGRTPSLAIPTPAATLRP